MKTVQIFRNTNYTIRLFGRNLLVIYNHAIIKLNAEEKKNFNINDDIDVYLIDEYNLSLCKGGETSLSLFSDYLRNQRDRIWGYIFIDKSNNEPIGYFWLFFPGSKEFEYKVVSEPMISNVYIFEKYRGRGYAGQMMNYALKICWDKGYKHLLAAVRKNNKSAWNAYKKVGFTIIQNKSFIRLLKINIPYYSL